jgi:mycofactocin precursor
MEAVMSESDNATLEQTDTDARRGSPSSSQPEPSPEAEPLVLNDLLVEEVSIDGMCGVY